MKKEIEKIDSVQKLIEILEDLNREFYFRGESQDFKDTKNLASGYRWLKGEDKTFDDLLKLRTEYYREVGYSLTEKERDNFISYSQHHGLPTELLDITKNPLVALYFICEKDTDKDGFLYLFDNSVSEKFLFLDDFRMMAANFDVPGIEIVSPSLDEQFIEFDLVTYGKYANSSDKANFKKQVFIQFLFEYSGLTHEPPVVFENGEYNLGVNPFLKDLVEEYHREKNGPSIESVFSPDFDFPLEVQELFDSYDGSNIREISDIVNSKIFAEIEYEEDDGEAYVSGYSMDITSCEDYLIRPALTFISKSNGEFFPDIHYLLHRPSVIFDRMRNQEGSFIYQLNYLDIPQKIIPSLQFVIPSDSKEKILKQLNTIGISEKFIYPDSDHIANYIKNRF